MTITSLDMVVKSRNSMKIKITHFDTVVAQGYECLKVNIDQTWPNHSTKVTQIWSQNTEQKWNINETNWTKFLKLWVHS